MAEIYSSEIGKQKAGFAKSKKRNARTDMTPMVDLGFLLITFFIFTSTMSEAAAMKLVMPKDGGATTPIKQSGALTILPDQSGELAYYEGFFELANVRTCSLKEIRDIIATKKARTPENDFFVVIKPSDKAEYGHIVDVLDEMTISGVQKYALADISMEEKSMIR